MQFFSRDFVSRDYINIDGYMYPVESRFAIKAVTSKNYDKLDLKKNIEHFKRILILQEILKSQKKEFLYINIPSKIVTNEFAFSHSYPSYPNEKYLEKYNINYINLSSQTLKFKKNYPDTKPFSYAGYHWSYLYVCELFHEFLDIKKNEIACVAKNLTKPKWNDGDLIPVVSGFNKEKFNEITYFPELIIKKQPSHSKKILIVGNSFVDQVSFFYQKYYGEKLKNNPIVFLDYFKKLKHIYSRDVSPDIKIINSFDRNTVLNNADKIILVTFSRGNNKKISDYGLIDFYVNFVLDENNMFLFNEWKKSKKNLICSKAQNPRLLINKDLKFNDKNYLIQENLKFKDSKKNKTMYFYKFKSHQLNKFCIRI